MPPRKKPAQAADAAPTPQKLTVARGPSPSPRALLDTDGLIAQHLPRYELRTPQLTMAERVEVALNERQHLLVEAATGTGKTLAYLIPALLSDKHVVVSTGSKALQEQIFQKDIPFLAKIWHEPIEAVLLKGRRNYLCKLRLDEMVLAPRFRAPQDAAHWPGIQTWAASTETGDRAELTSLPDDMPTWADLSIGSEACTGQRCKHYESCFVTRARKKAAEARLTVVNHHLFFADLALRQNDFGEILTDYDAVIFDEAHHLEEIASGYFGTELSNWRVSDLMADLRRAVESERSKKDEDLEKALKEVATRGSSLFTLFAFGLQEGRYLLTDLLQGPQSERITEAHRLFALSLTALERELKRFAGSSELSERLAQRASDLKFDAEALLKANDPKYTYFVDIRDRGVTLSAAPIDLAELFQKHLLSQHDTLIFTSATLATNDSFAYFKQRVGLDTPYQRWDKGSEAYVAADAPQELILPPIFDYATQSLVYIPERLPAPNSPGYQEGVIQIVEHLLMVSEGRAFVLFTSWSNMRAVHEALAERLPFTVLRQGDRPKAELLKQFREDEHSVLFATSSFWEGVDVEGDALKLVILDKLPFASPGDPLIRARMELIKSRGGDAFNELSVPHAALTLKQGFGRLIRSRTDSGVVAILDSRIAHKRYGSHFIKSLPPAPVVWHASQVKRWWQERFAAPSAP